MHIVIWRKKSMSYDFQQVGSEWRQFGNALKFNFTKLDALAAETESQVKKMFISICLFKLPIWIIFILKLFFRVMLFIKWSWIGWLGKKKKPLWAD